MAARNKNRDYIVDMITVAAASVDTNTSGDVGITFSRLKAVLENTVEVVLESGFVGNVQSVSGNVATVRIYRTGTSTDVALHAIGSSANVSILHARALGY